MAAGSTYTPIATTTLGSAQASYTFSSIPGTYTDLIVVVKGDGSANTNGLMQYNGDTGTNYSMTALYGTGSAAFSARSSNDGQIQLGGFDGASQGTILISILNYSNTTTYKTNLVRSNSGTYVQARVGLWRSTSAINSIKLYPGEGTWNTGTMLTLYGIQAA